MNAPHARSVNLTSLCGGCIIPFMSTKPTPKAVAAAEKILAREGVEDSLRQKAEDVLRRNNLSKPEPIPVSELGKKKPPKRLQGSLRGRRHPGGRKPPPVPKGKSREEIAEMDPDDPAFKHPDGAKRIPLSIREMMGLRSVATMDKQNRANARRAKVRKYEAEIVAAQRESMNNGVIRATSVETAEAALIAAGEMTLDDWSDEELIRGYRKNRNGKFGPPPKWVSQEVMQELHRRILKRGGKKMLQAYLESVDGLIRLARDADSEKVQLEAIKELQNRVSGKVPDRVAVSADDPWQDMLADAYVLPSELPPLDVEGSKRGAPEAPPSGPEKTAADQARSSSGVDARGAPPSNGNGKGSVMLFEEWE